MFDSELSPFAADLLYILSEFRLFVNLRYQMMLYQFFPIDETGKDFCVYPESDNFCNAVMLYCISVMNL